MGWLVLLDGQYEAALASSGCKEESTYARV